MALRELDLGRLGVELGLGDGVDVGGGELERGVEGRVESVERGVSLVGAHR